MVHSNSVPTARLQSAAAARCALPLLMTLAALTAQAQSPALVSRADPLDSKANVPPLSHVSSFAQYRRLSDEKLISWRDANDTVTRIGGWRVYAREAQLPDAVPANAPSPAPSPVPVPVPTPQPANTAPPMQPMPMPAGHGGHKSP